MTIDGYFVMVKNSLDYVGMRQMPTKKKLRKMLEKMLGPPGCVEKRSSEQLLYDPMRKLER